MLLEPMKPPKLGKKGRKLLAIPRQMNGYKRGSANPLLHGTKLVRECSQMCLPLSSVAIVLQQLFAL